MREISAQETAEIVKEVLDRLSAKQKAVIRYRFEMHLTYFQIARLTGLPVHRVAQIVREVGLKVRKMKIAKCLKLTAA